LSCGPNPFNPGETETSINFYMTHPGTATVKIYTAMGDYVATLADNKHFLKGIQRIIWDGRNEDNKVVRNGIYICVISINSLKPEEGIIKIGVVK
jgi:flagellar hook assembly protein FlgD